MTVTFYFALRRHGDTDQVVHWLQIMLETSDWRSQRFEENEVLRKDYLRLWQECRDYDANFEDTEMKRRQAENGDSVLVQERPRKSVSGVKRCEGHGSIGLRER